jgi:hypothetical protein
MTEPLDVEWNTAVDNELAWNLASPLARDACSAEESPVGGRAPLQSDHIGDSPGFA